MKSQKKTKRHLLINQLRRINLFLIREPMKPVIAETKWEKKQHKNQFSQENANSLKEFKIHRKQKLRSETINKLDLHWQPMRSPNY